MDVLMGCEWIYDEFKWGWGLGTKETEVKKRTFFKIENLHKTAVDVLPCYQPTGILDG